MKKYAQIYMVYFLFVSCISCDRQIKTELPKEHIKAESKAIIVPNAPNSITRTIKEDRNGNIWFASWQGMIRYDGTSFTNITKDVSSSRFFSVLEDRKGNFWFASIGGGVYYYDGNSFQNFTTKDGLANDSVTHIYEDKKGDIWFGTEGGVSCYDGKIFRNFTTKEGIPDNDINAIIEDNDGKFWFGTRGSAFFYDGETFTTLTNKDGSTFENIRSIIKDKKGNIWLGGKDGLWRYNGSTYTRFAEEFVGYIYEDRKGKIWTSSQSSYSSGWTLSRYEEQYLSDKKGKIWTSSNSNHKDWTLSPYDEKSLSNTKAMATEILTEPGMFFGILEDSDGNIWLGNLKGIYRYDGYTFDDFKEKAVGE